MHIFTSICACLHTHTINSKSHVQEQEFNKQEIQNSKVKKKRTRLRTWTRRYPSIKFILTWFITSNLCKQRLRPCTLVYLGFTCLSTFQTTSSFLRFQKIKNTQVKAFRGWVRKGFEAFLFGVMCRRVSKESVALTSSLMS